MKKEIVNKNVTSIKEQEEKEKMSSSSIKYVPDNTGEITYVLHEKVDCLWT
jgi:uncharacterized protein with ATP-grasp and redox domains